MTHLLTLVERGVAEVRNELVSLFRDKLTGKVRADLWSQPGIPRAEPTEEEIGRYSGPVTVIRLHWGRWIVAQEELARLELSVIARAKIERSRELGAYVPKAAAAVVSNDFGTQFIVRDTPEDANHDARKLAMHNRQYGLSGNRVDWYGDLV